MAYAVVIFLFAIHAGMTWGAVASALDVPVAFCMLPAVMLFIVFLIALHYWRDEGRA